MRAEELVKKLDTLGVNANSYSLGVIKNSDCTCVVKENDLWVVYYVERDKPSMQASFVNEGDAYDFVLMQFKKWLS
ncbi:hypothetical protein SD961_21570 [Erwinia sp. MMLR14_017]|uniref:hypothetical protein n=1 Tax=Erwinia sp. MMLR14_017 TaxID=3093842 RepID=UPI00298F5731|nr:hypothetical protein [Erwinia sp. MMLR14_017]MDW8848441.1 hypothetical protein [Erwinia sp. MMLR14_017]